MTETQCTYGEASAARTTAGTTPKVLVWAAAAVKRSATWSADKRSDQHALARPVRAAGKDQTGPQKRARMGKIFGQISFRVRSGSDVPSVSA